MTEQTYWLLTMVGNYDRGIGGLFSTEDAATAHAVQLDARSDHYHDWRIDEVAVDVPLSEGLMLAHWGHANRPQRDVPLTVNRRIVELGAWAEGDRA